METIERLDKRGRTIYAQQFQGREYIKYPKERYFKHGASTTWLHRAVWEYYKGKIPEGYHVHHKDENVFNNEIENLELLEAHEHLSMHMQEKMQDTDYRKKQKERFDYARIYASKWHGSKEGIEWHKKHGKDVANNLVPKEYTCMCCGKKYMAKPSGLHKFCSNKCKTKSRYFSGVDNEERICPNCGKTFIVNKYSRTTFCSSKCRRNYNKKIAESGNP